MSEGGGQALCVHVLPGAPASGLRPPRCLSSQPCGNPLCSTFSLCAAGPAAQEPASSFFSCGVLCSVANSQVYRIHRTAAEQKGLDVEQCPAGGLAVWRDRWGRPGAWGALQGPLCPVRAWWAPRPPGPSLPRSQQRPLSAGRGHSATGSCWAGVDFVRDCG